MAEETKFVPFTIERLRTIGDFARPYLWDIKFPEAPEPFTEWFPAKDSEEDLFSVESQPIEYYNFTIQIPNKLNLPKITLTFYDSESKATYKWIRNWIANTMFGMNVPGSFPYVAPLEDVVKLVYIWKLDHSKTKIVDFISYYVYPESIADHCTSENGVSLYSVPFVVAGMSTF